MGYCARVCLWLNVLHIPYTSISAFF
jgi:hypothetical protein